MDVSIISSFYRSEAHLPTFFERARRVAAGVRAAGISLEFLIVANDAQPEERRLIDAFAAESSEARVLYVGRETLYASWNRGVKESRGDVIGFWNADDARTADGVVEGVRRIRAGCQLVYFAYEIHNPPRPVRLFAPMPVDENEHRRRMNAGPFFVFARPLYHRVGPFDERFRINGDWEWCIRALKHTEFCHSSVNAGAFYIHGDNLSNTGSAREVMELNVVRLLHGRTHELTPAPPEAMREFWSQWRQEHTLPGEVEARLWGDSAQAAWDRWQVEEPKRKQAALRREKLRAGPKRVIDALGLRPLLARLGLVKARRK